MRRQDEVEKAADIEVASYQRQMKNDYRMNLDNQAKIKANAATERRKLEQE